MNKLNISVDLGFGFVKAVSEFKGKRHKTMFPSVLKERVKDKKFSRFFTSDDYIVDINDGIEKSYSIGDKAITDGAIREHADKGDLSENSIKAMLLTATHVLMSLYEVDFESIDLSLGLPLDYLEDNIVENLNKIVKGQKAVVKIKDIIKEIKFSDCNIYAQGIGAYYDAVLDWNGEVRQPELAVSSTAFIMVGYNTVEILALRMGTNGLNIVEDLSDTLNKKGMNVFLTEVQSLITVNEGVTVNVEFIERSIITKNTKNMLETSKGIINISKYVGQAKETYVKNLSSEIKRIWGTNEESFRFIYLAGASSPMIYELMKKNFKTLIQHGLDNEKQIRKDACTYANASGYLKMRKAENAEEIEG